MIAFRFLRCNLKRLALVAVPTLPSCGGEGMVKANPVPYSYSDAGDQSSDAQAELREDSATDVPADQLSEACSCESQGLECGKHAGVCGAVLECGSCKPGLACEEATGKCQTSAVAMVPLSDGVKLWTKVYLPSPQASSKLAAVLYRTPYRSPGVMQDFFDKQASFYNGLGYAFVLQDVRGTHESEGTLYLLKNEVADGRETVDWVSHQSWCTGRIATLGSSYDGYTALAAAVDNPSVALVLADDPSGGIYYWNRKGVLSMGTLSYYWGDVDDDTNAQLVATATNALDLLHLDQQVAGAALPVWQDMLAHPTPVDPYWDDMRIEPVAAQICAPVFLANSTGIGWDDPIRVGQALWTQGCAEHKSDVRVVVGNFEHGETMAVLPYGLTTQATELFVAYIDKFLGDKPVDLSKYPPLQLYAKGDSVARTSPVWPPTTQDFEMLYAHGKSAGSGTLEPTEPGAEPASELLVDPEKVDPCDDNDPGNSYILYTSAKLSERLFVAGHPLLTLHGSGSGKDADFFVTLLDYDPSIPLSSDAYSVVTWGMARARYRKGYEAPTPLTSDEIFTLPIEFPPVTWAFAQGHQIVLLVQGLTCSMIENPHTAESFQAQTHYVVSTHRVLQEPGHATALKLPVIERGETDGGSSGFGAPADSELVLRAAARARESDEQRRRSLVRILQQNQ